METHWSIHEFVAENADEISFKPGEPIVVIEKDEQYGDGWWQGRNARGEVGLFPRDYTAPVRPILPTSGNLQEASRGPVMAATIHDIQDAIDQIDPTPGVAHNAPDQRLREDDASSAPEDDDVVSPTDHSHGHGRALLAAKAKNQLEQTARAEAEARRVEEERMRLSDPTAPLVGLELSDESDLEDESPGPSLPGALDNGRLSSKHPASRSSFYPDDRPEDYDPAQQELRSAAFHSGRHSSSTAALDAVADRNVSSGAGRRASLTPSQVSGGQPAPPKGPRPPSGSSFTPSAYGRTSFDDAALAQSSRFSAATGTSGGLHETLRHSAVSSSSPLNSQSSQSLTTTSATVPPNDTVERAMIPRASSPTTEMSIAPPASSLLAASNLLPNSPPTATPESSRALSQARDSVTNATTVEDSPRSSIGPRGDPEAWSVEQVLEWGQQKGLDAGVLSKFKGMQHPSRPASRIDEVTAEHEISGDVLLEMDLNSLKEIDLLAFGRRVHVYNAIKELKKHRVGFSTPQGPLSPQLSESEPPSASLSDFAAHQPLGYAEAPGLSRSADDGFGTRSSRGIADASPQTSGGQAMMPQHFSSPGIAPHSPFATKPRSSVGHTPGDSTMRPKAVDVDIQGLGLQRSDGTGIARSQSMQGMTTASPVLAASLQSTSSTPVPSYSPQSRHARSTTADVSDSLNGPSVEALRQVAEEVGPDMDMASDGKATITRSGTKASQRSKVSQSQSDADGESPTAVANPDVGRFGSLRSPKMPFSGTARNRKVPLRNSGASDSPSGEKDSKQSRRSTRLFGLMSPQSTQPPTMGEARPVISAPVVASAPPPQPSRPVLTAGPNKVGGLTTDPSTGAPSSKPYLKQKGPPEMSGYLKRKYEVLAPRKIRFVALHGNELSWLKDPQAERPKGVLNVRGWKVIPHNDFGGDYGFKLCRPQHDTHYFSAEDPLTIRKWMKVLTKVNIVRDYNAPVLSSNNIATISLAEAQAMFPPPRPPSPNSRARAQQLRLASSNPNTLTPKDAEILMSLQKPGIPVAPPRSGRRSSRTPNVQGRAVNGEAVPTSPQSGKSPSAPPSPSRSRPSLSASTPPMLPPTATVSSPPSPNAKRFSGSASRDRDEPLLLWANEHLPPDMPPAQDLSSSFRSGQRLLRLAEGLSGRNKGISSARFVGLKPDSDEELDIGFDIFDFLTMELGVDTGDVSVGEMLRGERSQVVKLVEALRTKFDH